MTGTKEKIRYSGHETFVCRYAWLPKVVAGLQANPALFKDENVAMVQLGIGKNMVRSARFWAESAGVIEQVENVWGVTDFGKLVFGHEGYDEFLQQIETLWLLHWKLSTNPTRPLFHWHQLLNHWQRSEFCESEVIPFLIRGLEADSPIKSQRTFADGFKIFLHSYLPSRGRKGEIAEDNLDCPLVELGLIHIAGERLKPDQGRETIYRFNIEPKTGISSGLFAYCVHDYWRNSPHLESNSLGFRFVSSAEGSPGQIFKIPELSVRTFLENISSATEGAYIFEESSSMQQVTRMKELTDEEFLHLIYTPQYS